MPRGYGGAIPKDARTFAIGLILGFGGVKYGPTDIARIVNERFDVIVKPKTISNWKSALPVEMEKHGITERECKEAVARGLIGDLRKSEDIDELQRDEERDRKGAPLEPKTPLGEPETPIRSLSFSSIAEVLSFCEQQGFIVGKDLEDIKIILAANNLKVTDGSGEILGIADIFVTPIELDIEVVGRGIVANPIIGFYYAYERKRDPKLDLAQWLTTCVAELYSNLDKIYEDRKPVVLALMHG
ncbi:hypothetical protein ES703_16310 [subsurface metagenome]